MKKLLIGSLLATTSLCVAQEGKTHKHCFSPKAFYRYHDEKNYHYKTAGIGAEYMLYKPDGLNIKLSGITNFKDNNVLVETENTLFFRFPINEQHNLYPLLCVRYSSHMIQKVDEKSIFINLNTGFIGMGWERELTAVFQFRGEVSLFRELHTTRMVKENSHFWGKSYSNHSGAKFKVGITSQWKEDFFLDIEGYYSHTFEKCYKECGTEIGVNWGF